MPKIAVLLVLLAADMTGTMPVRSQTTQKPAFEVASIKPNRSGQQRAAIPVAFLPGGRFTATNATLVDVIVEVYPTRRVVSNILRVPVMDRTGLTGSYNFALDIGRFMPPPAGNGPQRADIFDIGNAISSAIEEQLGLKMEQHKELLDITIIDHAERPSEN